MQDITIHDHCYATHCIQKDNLPQQNTTVNGQHPKKKQKVKSTPISVNNNSIIIKKKRPLPKSRRARTSPSQQRETVSIINLDHCYAKDENTDQSLEIIGLDSNDQKIVTSYWPESGNDLSIFSEKFFELQERNYGINGLQVFENDAKTRFLRAFNLQPSNQLSPFGNRTLATPKLNLNTSLVSSLNVSDSAVFKFLSTYDKFRCDPTEEFHKTDSRISYSLLNSIQLNKQDLRSSRRLEKSKIDLMKTKYPQLVQQPQVVIKGLLKIYCITCARTSFFQDDTCYPMCLHISPLKDFIHKPLPKDIHELTTESIAHAQRMGELFFFYRV